MAGEHTTADVRRYTQLINWVDDDRHVVPIHHNFDSLELGVRLLDRNGASRPVAFGYASKNVILLTVPPNVALPATVEVVSPAPIETTAVEAQSPIDALVSTIKLGLDAESRDPSMSEAVPDLTNEQIRWLAAWIVSEGWSR